MASLRHYNRSYSEGTNPEYYLLNGSRSRACLVIDNLQGNPKAKRFEDVLTRLGFKVEVKSNLSAQEMESEIKSIKVKELCLFFLVILSEKGDCRGIGDNIGNIIPIGDVFKWINNRSMPQFCGIPRVIIYYGANPSEINYGYNSGSREADDTFKVCINDAKFGSSRDCDAVCEALLEYSSKIEFSEIIRKLGCTAEFAGFKKLQL